MSLKNPNVPESKVENPSNKTAQSHEERLTGADLIKDYVRHLGQGAGVYRMLGENSEVLYVGKAKNLKKRVANYTHPERQSARIARMIEATCEMMFLTTTTETEALLLEQNLIKQLKPKYNILLRDDKSFPNIFIGKDHDFPMVEKHRGAKRKNGTYFGPFAHATAVNRTINQLQKIFKLRNCSDTIFASRTRPCLQHQIERCSAPCVGRISKEDYGQSVKDASRFLKGATRDIQDKLAHQMTAASDALEFEKAAALRDQIRALTHIQSTQGVNPRTVNEADIIALHVENGQACVQVFFIRGHQNWGNSEFYPKVAEDMSHSEILKGFIGQFYQNKKSARLLIVSHDFEDREVMQEALSQGLSRKVEIAYPQRGERYELMMGAKRNASQALARRMSEYTTQTKLLKRLEEIFHLETPLKRVEIYDNSHIQGAHAIGAMIVSGPHGFEKSNYRKFNIKSDKITAGDDFGMMREVIERRFTRLLKEDPNRDTENWPNLLLIDGGAGQVSAVDDVMKELGIIDIPFIGVAKGVDRDAGKEEFYRPKKPPFALKRNDPALYFIQRLRDEAHRFAIGTHRAKRKKANFKNPLDDIPGIGASRKRALLSHFGSAKSVTQASVADLKSVQGISAALAQVIYDHFDNQT